MRVVLIRLLINLCTIHFVNLTTNDFQPVLMTCVEKHVIPFLVINNSQNKNKGMFPVSHGKVLYYLKFQKLQSNGISFMEIERSFLDRLLSPA